MGTVFLIGDSIRIGYQPLVARLLLGQSEVLGPGPNAGDSRNVLANLDSWLVGVRPDVIHFNCGLHDLRIVPPEQNFQVPLEEFAANLPQILSRLRRFAPSARVVWATITPVRDECYRDRKDFVRRLSDVQQYNEAALAAARNAGVEINDLYSVVEKVGLRQAIRDDGVHMTDAGNVALARAVADFVVSKTTQQGKRA